MNSLSHKQYAPAEQSLSLNTDTVPSWVAKVGSVTTYLQLRILQVPLAHVLVSEAQGRGG